MERFADVIFVSFILLSIWMVVYLSQRSKKVGRYERELDLDIEELTGKYKKWETYAGYTFCVFMLLFAFVYTGLFCWIARARQSVRAGEYLILPCWAIWGLHSLFFGIITAAIAVDFIFQRSMGKEEYREYEQYQNIKHGVMSKWYFVAGIMAPVLILAMITMPLCFDLYAKVNDSEIVINKFRGFGEMRYPLDQIKELKYVKSQRDEKGKIRRRKYHEIVFNDDEILSFDKGWHNMNKTEEVEIIKFISTHSGKEITIQDPCPKQTGGFFDK